MLKICRLLVFVTAFGLSFIVQAKGLKVHISVDMEGVVGVVTAEQLRPAGFEYQRFREFMTAEANAAIDAAFKAGATEVLVGDSHGNGQNLLIDQLPDKVQVVRSWPRPLGMMQGIESGDFDAAIFIGYHSGTAYPGGVRAHTLSSARITSLRLNGIEMNEAGINAVIAGHFNTPVVMISGDDAAYEESKDLLGDIEGAVVKHAYGFHSARTLTPEAAYREIGEKVKSALRRIDDFRPYKLDYPLTLEVGLKHYTQVEILAYLPNVERIDSHTIRFIGKDILEVSKFLQFMGNYSTTLQP